MARIPEIELSLDELERLVRAIEQHREEGRDLANNWERLHDDYLRQYRCIPQHQERLWPGGGRRSNLFLPLTRAVIEAYEAQQFDAMASSEQICEVRPLGPDGRNVTDAELLTIFYNEHVFKKMIPLREVINDYLFDLDLDGTAALKVRWRSEQELKRSLILERKPLIQVDEEEIDGLLTRSEVVIGDQEARVEVVSIEPVDKPVIDVDDMCRLRFAPDTVEDFQWPNCRWYYAEHEVPWEQMLERRRMGFKHIDDSLRAQLTIKVGTDRDDTQRQAEELSEGINPRTVTVEEHYMRWPLPARVSYLNAEGKQVNRDQRGVDDEDAFWEEVIVTYLPQVRKISRIRPLGRVYPNNRRPHISGRFIRMPRLLHGLGLAEKMSQLNALTNSAFNQMMDYGSLQNMPFFFYTPSVTGQLPDVIGIRPGGGVPVNDPRGVVIPRLQGDTNFWLAAMNFVQAFVERDGGITDFNLGRQGVGQAAPKTARGTQMLLTQGNIAFGRQVAMHKGPIVLAMEQVHSLMQQNSPEWINFAFLGPGGKAYKEARMSRRSLEQELRFDVVLNPNKSAEQQKIQGLFQMIMQTLPVVAQMPVLLAPARRLTKKLWDLSGQKDFDQIWPPELTPQLPQETTFPPATKAAPPLKESELNIEFPTPRPPQQPTNGDGAESY